MLNTFYSKLAFQNIKKNSRYYIPFTITSVLSVAMFFIIFSLTANKGLADIKYGGYIGIVLNFSMVIMILFFCIFLNYTYGFLVKKRQKEFGLYSVLGMEKKHICLVSFLETAFIFIFSLVVGIGFGILFSKLSYLLLLKLLNFNVGLDFTFEPVAFISTILTFLFIFALIIVGTFIKIHKVKTIDLLHSENIGEREPKTKIIMTIVGFLTLGGGYAISLSLKNLVASMPAFILAVILVTIGTYCLFTAGSIAFLKILRKNKNYYYKTNHFVSVSSMMYRMKQNAVGLSNICVLASAVLVMISSTVSLYAGIGDVVKNRCPRDMCVSFSVENEEQAKSAEIATDKILEQYDINPQNSSKMQVVSNHITDDTIVEDSFNGFAVKLISIEDYNVISNQNIVLNENEVIMYCNKSKDFPDNFDLKGRTYIIKDILESLSFEEANDVVMKTYYIFTNNIETAQKIAKDMYLDDRTFYSYTYNYNFDFDKDIPIAEQEQLKNKIGEQTPNNCSYNIRIADIDRQESLSLFGGLLFIGIFLGMVCMIATVLIIYYKQISEGFDDKERFNIMKKVGMSEQEIRKSIKSQVLMVFFLPLIVAIIHMIAAFPLIAKMLMLLGLINTNVFLFALIATIVVFAIIYTIVYMMTSRVYYKIVSK